MVLFMTCKVEVDVEDIGMVRGRATPSPHEHPTKTRNRRSSRFITRHSRPTHALVSFFSKTGGDPACVVVVDLTEITMTRHTLPSAVIRLLQR